MGSTSPAAMRRSVASPDAETVSYWPVRISWTASSEVPNVLTVTWQPDSFSKSLTQSTLGSLLPSSTYPGHASTLTFPSGVPSLARGLRSGTLNPPAPVEVVVPPEPPQAARASAARAATAVRAVVLRLVLVLMQCSSCRVRDGAGIGRVGIRRGSRG